MLAKGNVVLRAVEPSDVDNMYVWENDVSVWKISQTFSPYSEYTLQEYSHKANISIQEAKQFRFIIDIHSENEITSVGIIDVFDYDSVNQKAAIGILIGNHSYRRKGIACLSLEIAADYCFNILNLHQIYCYIGKNNIHSIGLFESQGFLKSGILKDWILHKITWEDVYIYQRFNNIL
jgi:diamine N-acetyltransferase